MSEWYESAFSKAYLALYPHRNDEEARRDVAHIASLLDLPKDQPILDLCCGAGRHLEALNAAGFSDLTGLDLSEDLLSEARARLDQVGAADLPLVRSDMREIPFEREFAAILSLFTSFGYFANAKDDLRVLQGAHRALRNGGILLMDTMNRAAIVANLIPHEIREHGDLRIHIVRGLSADGARVEKETRIVTPGKPDSIYRESVRMYTRRELEELFEASSFIRIQAYGGLDGCPYSPTSDRMVFVASKQGGPSGSVSYTHLRAHET